ncbi:MAG: CbiX/SirB N-terminal domain-containing protein [Acetobacteraceae bacterium]|nr:CbiX/SirB N-terminal domain-containing protein [Acetobacteraceae bacterium]
MFREHALLLVAHGSARYADAARVVEAHAAALRAEGVFAAVAVGLLNGTPEAALVLAGLPAPIVHVVPFFMEAGWFTQTAVPRALGLDGPVTQRNGRVLRYAAPVGTHAGMAAVIEDRVLRTIEASLQPSCPVLLSSLQPLLSPRPLSSPQSLSPIAGPSAATGGSADGTRVETSRGDVDAHDTGGADRPALLVVGHGSARSPGRVTALHGHVARLATTGRFRHVAAAFLEEPPFAAAAIARFRGVPLAVVGFFAGEGGHVRDDLPALIAAERAHRGTGGPPLLDCGSIGEAPAIRRIILDLVVAAT